MVNNAARRRRSPKTYDVVEICAGAGGQALGLERAGFSHRLAVELDAYACATLRTNRPDWRVAEGDVANTDVWNPADYEGVDLLAGGVPCPPFSIAGKQLGASDERDLFAWAVEMVEVVKPRALMLENVRGLSTPRFAAYRQRILDRLADLGYVADWRLLHASEFGVPQLRPRFVLVALNVDDAPYFAWPEPIAHDVTVGSLLKDLMGERGWKYVDAWAEMANGIGPTLVGGSKKHGGADLGPTRAKAAWRAMGVDGMGIANEPPERTARHPKNVPPKLTIDMVARLQGWDETEWTFSGKKTANYRQIGNAFPPPVAKAVGESIINAFNHKALKEPKLIAPPLASDAIFEILRDRPDFVTAQRIMDLAPMAITENALERRLAHLSLDFELEIEQRRTGVAYRLGNFKGFVGQENHTRHQYIATQSPRIS